MHGLYYGDKLVRVVQRLLIIQQWWRLSKHRNCLYYIRDLQIY